MFASQKKNVDKKTFQKPNILRRITKVSIPKPNISNANESPEARALVRTTSVKEGNISHHLDKITNLDGSNKPTNVTKAVWKLTLASSCEDNDENESQETDIDANINTNASISSNITQIESVGKSLEQSSLNIESFINDEVGEQDMPLFYGATLSENKITQAKSKWCFDITNNSMDIIINNYRQEPLEALEEKLDSIIVLPSVPSSDQNLQQVHNQVLSTTKPTQTIVDCYSNKAVKFKCDQHGCNKGFWSEEKLRKHINSHNRQVYRTPATQAAIECPVKKVADDGSEERCPRTFDVRSDLLKHLNEDHSPEDAQHRCGVCGRRFFFSLGLRAHGASRCARGGLACAWPGCARVFRLPCRLREHARAHTGDRPYLCRYPDCGWAFRSASKLVRHARRHTDERRHACTTCGRAFMRREHLRDHNARHHQHSMRATHLCTHPGCEQTFTNMSTLYLHMKKVHRKVEKDSVAPVAPEPSATVLPDRESLYVDSLASETAAVEDSSTKEYTSMSAELEAEGSESVSSVGSVGGTQWHAARTHCTWPLPRHAHAQYVLDDDAQVERTEGSGSDVYTVRSDLFLHGNEPIDEDSQQIGGAPLAGEALGADLCLIDAHPTIDLMQEELMYEDAAVDESSFRVFLMNGEELA